MLYFSQYFSIIMVIAVLSSENCSAHHKTLSEVVVKVNGPPENARILAKMHGFYFKGAMSGFSNTYIFIPYEEFYPNKNKRNGYNWKSEKLTEDNRVLWVEKQHIKQRQKRDFLNEADIPLVRVKRIQHVKGNDQFNKTKKLKLRKRKRSFKESDTASFFNDELWGQEWYLQDTRTHNTLPKLDLNVLPVYKAGITGKGVRISILDDGIEYTHDDLKNNYDPDISYDCNEEDYDPLPRYDPATSNNHGTRCAGEVAMTADNGKCGVGIAFNSRIGGIKLLDGLITDRIEGTALSFGRDLIDIYSASWGPKDDGKTVDGPGRLALEALEMGIKMGRNGKGSIYVWASGNGGIYGDNCNCDGYLNSIYTVSISSASQKGEFPWYAEACSSTLAVTYSSGAYRDQMIATTDLNNNCTNKHTGTSASAPLAAGIIALALEANPSLTWRDVQHLIVWTSEIDPLVNNPGWSENGANLWFNNKFGFGLMNAYGLVKNAVSWVTVPEKNICVTDHVMNTNHSIFNEEALTIPLYTSGCSTQHSEVNYLEHVELKVDIEYYIRGSLEIYLISPSGTKVQVLAPRKLDNSSEGFKGWKFMSVMTWGENPVGTWHFTVVDNVRPSIYSGKVNQISLILHGTKELPHHMMQGPRVYNVDYNRVHNRYQKYETN